MEKLWKEIPVTEIEGFEIGNAENSEAGTGCTVILSRRGAVTGCDVRGGAPASRENALLDPLAANDAVNAVVLSGGSAFGLDAASGVMQYLEEQGCGFETMAGVVPIVVSSCIFDLPVGSAAVRPDRKMGYEACQNLGNFREGNHGAGTGASCGKAAGMEHAMKSGLGAYAVQLGDLKVGAIVAANPLGNITDTAGNILAGIHDESGSFISAEEALLSTAVSFSSRENTTIGVILTNGRFNKTELCKIAGMAHDGMARAVRPVHTLFDGDTLYASSVCTADADINVAGTLAAIVTAEAIARCALEAEPAYGLRGAKQ